MPWLSAEGTCMWGNGVHSWGELGPVRGNSSRVATSVARDVTGTIWD